MKLFVFMVAIAAGPAQSQDYYANIHLGSKHIGATRDFNELNLGLGLGVRWGDQFRYGLEVGAYNNSYSEWATYAGAFAQYRVLDGEVWDTYLGGTVMLAEYPNLVGYADKYGIPRVGNHIVIPSLSAEFDHGDYSIALHGIFGLSKADAVVGLSVKFRF